MSTKMNDSTKKIIRDFEESNANKSAPILHKNLSAILEASPPLVAQYNQELLNNNEKSIKKIVSLTSCVKILLISLFAVFFTHAQGISPPLPPDESYYQTAEEVNKHLPSHPLSSKQVTQIMTTLIELPFAKIDKKNIEKLFSVELKELTSKSDRWRFDAREDWSIILANSNQMKKKNVNLTISIRKYNNFIKKYAESDIPICFSADDLKGYLERNKWEVPREQLRPPSPGHHEPYEYFVKNQTRISFSFLTMDTPTKTLNCIYEFHIGYRK